MIITQVDEKTYTFKNRGVDYTVIESGSFYEVWCKRGRTPNPPRVMTAEEMRAGSKVLSNFISLITAH